MRSTNFTPLFIFILFMCFLSFKHFYTNDLPSSSEMIINLKNMKSIDGNDLKVPSSKYLIHVIASWCNICKNEHKIFDLMIKRSNIPVIALIFNDEIKNIRSMIKDSDNPYSDIAILKDEDVLNLGVSGVPETIIVNENGISILRIKGSITEQIFKDDIYPKFTRD